MPRTTGAKYKAKAIKQNGAVSYTHLTQPTKA